MAVCHRLALFAVIPWQGVRFVCINDPSSGLSLGLFFDGLSFSWRLISSQYNGRYGGGEAAQPLTTCSLVEAILEFAPRDGV